MSVLENTVPELHFVSSPPEEGEQRGHFLPSEMQPKLTDDPGIRWTQRLLLDS